MDIKLVKKVSVAEGKSAGEVGLAKKEIVAAASKTTSFSAGNASPAGKQVVESSLSKKHPLLHEALPKSDDRHILEGLLSELSIEGLNEAPIDVAAPVPCTDPCTSKCVIGSSFTKIA